MGNFIRFTEEQIEAANSVRISEILDREGEKYRKWGKQFQWMRHDSVIFCGSKWFRYSEGEGGRAISFCMKFLGKSFPDAVEYLLEFLPEFGEKTPTNGVRRKETNGKKLPSRDAQNEPLEGEVFPSRLRLPEANPTMKNAYRYLIRERLLDPEVVSFFAREGALYEERKCHGVVFLGKDKNGAVRNAHVRGTIDGNHGKFRMTVEGSDAHYGFGYAGPGTLLYAFEAPIDLMSFVSYRRGWKEQSYVALNGVGGNAVFRFLEEYPNVRGVVLCLDNDEAGEKASFRIARQLREMGVTDVRRLASVHKDWNEDLIIMHAKLKETPQTQEDYLSAEDKVMEDAKPEAEDDALEDFAPWEGGHKWNPSLD